MSGIVVAGCGIAGLEAALRIERNTDRNVTVVDPDTYTLFYPSLHHVLDGRDFEDVRIDIEKKFSGRDIELVQNRVTGMDPDEKVMMLEGSEIKFEKAVIAVGSTTSYGSIEGEGNVHDLRFRDDTAEVVERIENNSIGSVTVIGGGATGIEAAASLYCASNRLRDFSITVLESEDRILPQFIRKVSRIVEKDYGSRGIEVKTGTHVSRIEDGRLVLQGGEELESDLIVWAGGVEPNPVINDFGLEQGKDGLKVDGQMRCTDDIYAAGDIVDYEGKVNRAFYSIEEAKTVASNIARDLKGEKMRQHRVRWEPNLIYLGHWDSLFELNGFTWRGRFPALMRSIGVEKRHLWVRRNLL